MRYRGKKYKEAEKKREKGKLYSIPEAIETVKQMKFTKFDESVDVAVRLNVDPRHSDQMVRGTVVLPHGTGKTVRVLVFAKGDKIEEAKKAGADFAGADELVEKVAGGWTDFDVAISTKDMMPQVGKLGKILGPKGLMPSPKVGTVTDDIEKVVRESKAGRIEFKVDKAGIIHAPIGKISFESQKLQENLLALLETIIKLRPPAVKGQYIKSIALSSTMGPSVRINPDELAK